MTAGVGRRVELQMKVCEDFTFSQSQRKEKAPSSFLDACVLKVKALAGTFNQEKVY